MQSNYPNNPSYTDEAVTHKAGHGAINTGGLGTGLLTSQPGYVDPLLGSTPLQHSTGLVGSTGTTGWTKFHGHAHRTDPKLIGTTAGTTAGTTGLSKHANRGTITFRPIEGKFNKDKDLIGKMDPYCKFKIGWHRGKSSVAKSEGTNPTWGGDAITIKCKGQEFAKIKVKDHDRLRHDDNLGTAKIPLAQLYQQGSLAQWIPLAKRDVVVGEVYVEMEYAPRI